MTTESSTSHRSTKKASSTSKTRKPAAKKSKNSSATTGSSSKAPKAEQTSHCWPGFEPVPGKARNAKGSCKPKAGKQPKTVRRADQKAAAASKLQKTNPR